MNSKKIDCLLLVLYCVFIYWISSRSTLPTPMWFENQDKIYHAGAYGLMGIFTWRCFRHFINTPIILGLLTVSFCSLYGVSDEWHQSFVPGRDSSYKDWIADTVGAIIAAYLTPKIHPKISAENHEAALTNCAIDCANCAFHDAPITSHPQS